MNLSIRKWLEQHNLEMSNAESSGSEIAAIAFRLTQDMELNQWTYFDVCPLAEALAVPLPETLAIAEPLNQITLALLRIGSRQKPLIRAEGAWLAFQVAYLRAILGLINQETRLQRPWLQRGQIPPSFSHEPHIHWLQLQAYVKTLQPGKLSDYQAEQALSLVNNSLLIGQMHNLAIAWLIYNGTEQKEAELLVQRLGYGLRGYLLELIVDHALPLAQLQKFVKLGIYRPQLVHQSWLQGTFSSRVALERNKEYYRASLIKSLSEPILGEPFALNDIYVPLVGLPIDFNSDRVQPQTTPVILQHWFEEQLKDKSRISIIEGNSASGKTSFCQICAAWLAQEIYPQWMPVLIPLAQIELGRNLGETLASVLPQGHFDESSGWFAPDAPPCVLICDGLDELAPLPDSVLEPAIAFLDQILQFQEQHLDHEGQPRHKIIITSSKPLLRERTQRNLIRKYRQQHLLPLPTQLEGIVIQGWSQDQLQIWFKNWTKLQSKSIAQTYFSFLKQQGIFHYRPPIATLSPVILTPLMLHILGVLHRDGWLDNFRFRPQRTQFILDIYQRLLCWMLGEIPSDIKGMHISYLPEIVNESLAHACRSPEAIANLLSSRTPQQLRSLLQELAVKLNASTTSVLTLDSPQQPLPEIFFRVKHLNNQQVQISFSHPQLGQQLTAEVISNSLMVLCHPPDALNSDDEQSIARHLYQSLGQQFFEPNLEYLIIEHLRYQEQIQPHRFSFNRLFQHLLTLYKDYCHGKWLNQGLIHQFYDQSALKSQKWNIVQIDTLVGLNSFSLLCLIAQAAHITFAPCGNNEDNTDFEPARWLNWMQRTAIFPHWQQLIKKQSYLHKINFTGAYLHQLNLSDINLQQANLTLAQLNNTNLSHADLQQANLAWANLTQANFYQANLSEANLEGANLVGANLRETNLTLANFKNACIFQAQIDEDSLKLALQQGAIASWSEFISYNQSLLGGLSRSDFPDTDFLITNGDQERNPALFTASLWDKPENSPETRQEHPNLPPITEDISNQTPETQSEDDHDDQTWLVTDHFPELQTNYAEDGDNDETLVEAPPLSAEDIKQIELNSTQDEQEQSSGSIKPNLVDSEPSNDEYWFSIDDLMESMQTSQFDTRSHIIIEDDLSNFRPEELRIEDLDQDDTTMAF